MHERSHVAQALCARHPVLVIADQPGAGRWLLRNDAVFRRTEIELILKSRRVVLRRLLADSVFNYPRWVEAARDLCRKRESELGLTPV
jgi:hypothetical protein